MNNIVSDKPFINEQWLGTEMDDNLDINDHLSCNDDDAGLPDLEQKAKEKVSRDGDKEFEDE